MTIQKFTLQVLNPDNPDDMPILEFSGTWVECAEIALDTLIPGKYPAIRTFHTETDLIDIGGSLRITDKSVKWVETVHFAANATYRTV